MDTRAWVQAIALIAAIILAVLAGCGVPSRANLGWFALACVALALLAGIVR